MLVLCRLLICLLLLTGSISYADEEALFDQYTLQASAEGDVTNDLMTVNLVVQHENRDAKVLAEQVNSDMSWALDQLKPGTHSCNSS